MHIYFVYIRIRVTITQWKIDYFDLKQAFNSNLAQILSAGLHLTACLPYDPVSVGAGLQIFHRL